MAGEHEELRGFVGDAVSLLDARAAGVRPDVEAMLARARAIAAEEPLASVLLSERGSDGVVIPLGRAEGGSGAALGGDEDDAEAGLGAFTSALRAELDAKVHERSLTGIPPLVRRRRWGAVAGGILAMAAALVLIVAGAGIVGRAQREGAGLANAAGDVAAPAGEARGAVPGVVPAAREVRDGAGSAGAGGEDGEGAVGGEDRAVPGDRSVAVGGEDGAVPGDRVVAPAKVRGKRRGPVAEKEAGPSLEDEAQALWQRGELAAAEQKLREVLRVAGGSRRAELAYGDLFALVRQMHGADGQAALWREYLGKFPGGRFADDARAGLCQRTAAAERAACWREYLEEHPAGAHRGRAAAAIGGSEAGP